MDHRVFIQCTHHTVQETPNNGLQCYQCKKKRNITRLFFCKICNTWQPLLRMEFPKEYKWSVEYTCKACRNATRNPKSKDEVSWI